MMHERSSPPSAARTSLQAIASGWRRWRARRRAQAEIAALGAESGLIAHDLKLTGSELARLSRHPASSAVLLNTRMEALGLSPVSIANDNPAVMRDLQRACSFCELKSQCSRDLDFQDTAPAISAYCPNEQTLNALHQDERIQPQRP